jgi:hypothetical protein
VAARSSARSPGPCSMSSAGMPNPELEIDPWKGKKKTWAVVLQLFRQKKKHEQLWQIIQTRKNTSSCDRLFRQINSCS